MESMHGTTIIGIKHNGKIAIGGDGQVTLGNTVMKATARKIRRLYDDKVVVGFAGATADAFTLTEKFEERLKQYKGNLLRSAVELAKEWRSDKMLRHLEAMMIVGDKENLLVLTGNGDVLEPDDGVVAIGSGGNFALAAAKALVKFSDLSAKEIAEESLQIASGICIYTNSSIIVEEI
ncbi:MAG: ATP-dependent protease subunit HslV [Candidatus Stygibacter australis]|nr:ATP-dependent protease subunit HslV [Candidatus Stygibacter australis]MDP8321076.1 ATP-dependent protease subunit HslV [Candidatus Stygibacter australis]